jgi:hypothetical protein
MKEKWPRGAGLLVGDHGEIRKSDHFRDGGYRFGD